MDGFRLPEKSTATALTVYSINLPSALPVGNMWSSIKMMIVHCGNNHNLHRLVDTDSEMTLIHGDPIIDHCNLPKEELLEVS